MSCKNPSFSKQDVSISLDQMITYNMCGVYITLVYSVKHPARQRQNNRQMWRCGVVEMCICGVVEMWMWRCGDVDVEMWRCVDVEMWMCGYVDVEMCRCGDVDV